MDIIRYVFCCSKNLSKGSSSASLKVVSNLLAVSTEYTKYDTSECLINGKVKINLKML